MYIDKHSNGSWDIYQRRSRTRMTKMMWLRKRSAILPSASLSYCVLARGEAIGVLELVVQIENLPILRYC